MRVWLAVGMVLAAGCAGLADHEEPRATSAAIAATHPLAVRAGVDVLAAGGNAFDAAAVIQFVLNVVEPGMSGIGGGAFFVGFLAETGDVVALDGRETAPMATRPDVFTDQDDLPDDADAPAHVRGTAVGVPGTLALWDEVLRRYGTLSLSEALQPAVQVAEVGFVVDGYLARYVDEQAWKFRSWPASAQLFLPGSTCLPTQAGYTMLFLVDRCVGGTPLAAGDLLRQPDLAATFRLLQQQGPDAFYKGPIAQAMVDAVASRDGVMTLADLAAYKVVERAPVSMPYRGHDVVTFPAPGGGLVVAQILGILSGFDLAAMSPGDRIHVIAEATSLAYADRGAYEADPAFVDVPQQGMLHPEYLAARRDRIRMEATVPHPPGDPWAYQPGSASHPAPSDSRHEGVHTTHFVVADAAGNVASVTSTIEDVWGTGMVVPGYGFLLNNELTDFATDPAAANAPAGGKRPRSSMSPTIVLHDGKPIMAVGASGGPRIIVGTLDVLVQVLDLEASPQDAVAAQRFYSPDSPGIAVEQGSFGAAIDADLRRRGHQLSTIGHVANVQALVWNGTWAPAADDRAAQGAVWQGVDDA